MILAWLLVIPVAGLLATLLVRPCPVRQARVALLTSLASCGCGLALVGGGTLATHAAGDWPAPYGILLRADGLSRLMVLLTGCIMTAATAYHLAQAAARPAPALNATAFPLLLLALNGLFVTGDAFNFYVCFELLAISSYLVVSQGSHHGLEAAWKYSAQSVLGSICLLTGIVLLYGMTGTLTLSAIAARLDGPALTAAPFLLVAFLLKGALFPFHYWQPDAHAAATTAGSIVLAGLLITVGLYGLLRFWPIIGAPPLAWLLQVLGGASVLFGALAAWRQQDAKRMLGYSSISQLGFPLMALGWGDIPSLAAALFFLVGHAVAKALLFAGTGMLADSGHGTRFRRLAGTGGERPLLAATYLLGTLSLAGLPPTPGFVGKLGLLQAGLGAGAWTAIAVIAVGSLMTLGYGLRGFHLLFWLPAPAQAPQTRLTGWLAVGWLAGTLAVITVGAGPLWTACRQSAEDLLTAAAKGGPR